MTKINSTPYLYLQDTHIRALYVHKTGVAKNGVKISNKYDILSDVDDHQTVTDNSTIEKNSTHIKTKRKVLE